jgi:hypothetical protein
MKDNPIMPAKKRGRPSKKEQLEKAGQASFFDLLNNDKEALANLRSMLAASRIDDNWRGMFATPPGSLLETVINAFKTQTNIPLEIPFFATMHYLSQHLLAEGVQIDFMGNTINPDLWNVILAPSGSSKSFTLNSIKKIIKTEDGMPEPASSAKFIDNMQEHNKSGWVQDEFGKFLASLDLPQLQELKAYLLKTYDGQKIERQTMKKVTVIEDPALAILGMTVLETFIDELPAGSLVDGFAQRFSYIIAKRDPDRKMADFPVYSLQGWDDQIRNEWHRVIDSVQHQKYFIGKEAQEAYTNAFRNMIPEFDQLDESFYRRILWRGTRYALMYHILQKKESPEIDAVDMGWAARVIQMHLRDAATLLTEHHLPDLARILHRCAEVKEKVEKKEGRPVKPRDLVQGVHGISRVNEAQAYLNMLNQ